MAALTAETRRLAASLSGRKPGRGLTPETLLIAKHLARGGALDVGKGTAAGGALKVGGGGGGFNWKELGIGALNTLSVPGAVVTTSLTNAIQGAKGEDLVSWKNLGGTFRGDKFQGGRGLAKAFGVDSPGAQRWFGLGLDIALDPLTLVGGGAAYKVASAGTRFGHLKEAARLADEFAEAGTRIGKDSTAVSDMLRLRIGAETARAKAAAEGYVPSLRLGIGRKTVEGVRVGRGLEVPLWYKPIRKKNLNQRESGRFVLAPLAEVVGRGQDAARGVAELSVRELDAELKALGATDAVMGRVGSVMQLANDDRAAGRIMIEEMRAAGRWGATEDAAMSLMVRYGLRQAKQLGWVTHHRQARLMDSFLKGRVDDLNATLAASAEDIARVDDDLARATDDVRAARADAIRRLDESTDAEVARVSAQAERVTSAAQVMETQLEVASRQLDAVTAQLAARFNDPKYARQLIASSRGQRLRGWSPKDQAQKLAQQRRSALLAQQRQLARRVQAMRSASEALTRQATKASKALDSKLAKLNATRGKEALRVIDKFQKMEREAAEKFAKRREMLVRAFGDISEKQTRELASEARVFAANNKLFEFTKGRRWELGKNGGPLVPSKGTKATSKREYDLDQIMAKVTALMNRGSYIKRAPDQDMLDDVRDFMNVLRSRKEQVATVEGNLIKDATRATRKRTTPSPYSVMTRETTVEQMVKTGIPRDEAEWMADFIGSVMKFAKEDVPFSKQNIPGITYKAELNAFALAKGREEEQYNLLLRRSFLDAVNDAFEGTVDAKGMWNDLTTVYNTKRIAGSPAQVLGYARRVNRDGKKVPGDIPRAVLATGWLKVWYTVANAGHFFMNIFGSYVNDLLQGGWRHAATGLKGHLPGGEAWRLAQADLSSDVMNRTYKLGRNEYTGAQVATMARLSGLGIGYTQAEIEMVTHLFNSTRKSTAVARMMNKLNMDRENADRVWSWMNHIKSGDDPLTAAARVIRTKFDYNAATQFERIWARNLMLFYTWFKNNLVLQGYGLLTRPGIYSTLNHIEHSRPKDPAEPSWWKKAGGLYSPFGLLTFGNPLADIYKYELTQDNARKNLLGALTPFIGSPLQLATNKDFFTGGDLSKFSDQNTPSPLGYLLNPLGIGEPSRARAEGDRSPAVPWYLAKLFKDFTGPYGSTVSNLTSAPDAETSPWHSIMPRLVGARVNPVEPEKWERSLKARETKRKADATRKRNYEKP